MGSSPLTRGKQREARAVPEHGGLIPAHAGKTPCTRQRRVVPAAHPRSRGENLHAHIPVDYQTGSSPLTRGKRPPEPPVTRWSGLIPAHAGKTNARPPTVGHCRAHPRSRGENTITVAVTNPISGSSPLTRGKRPPCGLPYSLRGLIPAHAGKTPILRALRPGCGAHPRSRGENLGEERVDVSAKGSSPLTRGKPYGAAALDFVGGLIPAHAGKTARLVRGQGEPRAHPRSRGENSHRLGGAEFPEGSSPLTRGKPIMVVSAAGAVGLIPAHAGKTYHNAVAVNGYRAHPRSRGENRE